MKKLKTLSALGLSAALVCGVAGAEDLDASRYITGDWGGKRAELADKGVDLKLGYFSQAAHNFSGGDSDETAYADQFFVGTYVDLEKLFGWSGAEFKMEITNRNGTLINTEANIPFVLQSQQIFGRGTVTRLTQFSLTQKLLDDRLSIKVGRIYPSADFFSLSCAFQHLQFCSGGSSNYISGSWYGDPLSAWGGVVTFTPDKRWYFKVGGYDTNPQNLSKDQGLKLGTSGDDSGTMGVAEIEYKADYGNGIDGHYRIGVTRVSNNKDKIVNLAGFPTGLTADPTQRQDTDNALFINLEQQVTRNESGGGLRLFTSLIKPDSDVSSVEEVFAIGAFIDGPFPARPNDRVGLAIGRNKISSDLTDAQQRYNQLLPVPGAGPIGVQRYEYPIELNYNFALTNAIAIMPSLQYIRHPGGLDNADNATILGVQFSLNF